MLDHPETVVSASVVFTKTEIEAMSIISFFVLSFLRE